MATHVVQAFTQQVVDDFRTHVAEKHENIFQIIGIFAVVYLLYKNKVLCCVLTLLALTIYTCAYTVQTCLYWDLEALFVKLAADGVCKVQTSSYRGQQLTYYECAPKLPVLFTTHGTEL